MAERRLSMMETQGAILITGSTGTVGREVARALSGRAAIRLGVRESTAEDQVRFDFTEPSTHEAALEGIDRVFLLRPPALGRPDRDFGAFIAAMERAGVRQVAFLSVRGAERNPLLPHRGIEMLLKRSRLAWTFLRPNDFMQNFATVHRADIRDRGEIWAPAGSGRTSFVDVRDVGEAAAKVLTEPGHERRAYSLTGCEVLDLFEVARILSDVLGRRIVYRNPGVVDFLRHIRTTGRPMSLGFVMTGVYAAARLGLASGVEPDLRELLGRAPNGFRAFAEAHADSWRPDTAAP